MTAGGAPRSARAEPSAFELSLRALGRKERTEAELAEWLRARQVEEEELAATLAQLIEAGAVDDRRFAIRFAEDKRELAGWGSERIREALVRRGVAVEHVEVALAAESRQKELTRAAALLAQRAPSLDDDHERERALRLLARRGFSLELAHDAIRARARQRSG